MATTEELQSRINRIYAAIEATVEKDISKIPIKRKNPFPPELNLPQPESYWDFSGGMSQGEMQNIAWSAIHNIAVFYNYCRTWAEKNNIPREEVDFITDNSLALRVLRDLDNNDKHPTARANSSGLFPKLGRVFRGARLARRNDQQGLSINSIVGATMNPATTIEIFAEVVDSRTGEHIGRLDEILIGGLSGWEYFLTKHNLLSQNVPQDPQASDEEEKQ